MTVLASALVEIRLLGPFALLEGEGRVGLAGVKERALLAFLGLHAEMPVSQDTLLDAVWEGVDPAAAARSLHVRVANLRRLVGSDALTRGEGGYILNLSRDAVDALKFASLVERARAEPEGRRSLLLEQALELWQGQPLSGLGDPSWAIGERRRLEELRFEATELLLAERVAAGHAARTIMSLHALVDEQPLRERPRELLMRALYQVGRQADALELYRRTQMLLDQELGVEPGPGLRQLERAILTHDPGLAPPPKARVAMRGRAPLAVAAIVVTIAAAAGLVVIFARSGGARPVAVTPDSLVSLDPRTGRVISVTRVGATPVSLTLTPTAVWVVNRGDRTVSRVDRATHSVHTFGGVPFAYDVAADREGDVWVSGGQTARVANIVSGTGGFPTTPAPATSFRLKGQAGAEAIGGGALWVSNGAFTAGRGTDAVTRIDLRSLSAARPIHLTNMPSAIAFGFGAAWIGTFDAATDEASLTVIQPGATPLVIPLAANQPAGPLSITTGNGSVWILTFSGVLIRVDPEARRVLAHIKIGSIEPPGPSTYEPLAVAAGAGAVWVTDRADDSIAQIDPRTNRLVRTIPLGSLEAFPCDIAATPHRLWVTIAPDSDCGSSLTR